MSKCLQRKLPTNIRTLLCMKPVLLSSLIPASTNGYPVCPLHQASKSFSLLTQRILSYLGLKLSFVVCGKCHNICMKNSRQINSFKKVILSLFEALSTIFRILTVPNRKCVPNFEVLSFAGKFLVSS